MYYLKSLVQVFKRKPLSQNVTGTPPKKSTTIMDFWPTDKYV